MRALDLRVAPEWADGCGGWRGKESGKGEFGSGHSSTKIGFAQQVRDDANLLRIALALHAEHWAVWWRDASLCLNAIIPLAAGHVQISYRHYVSCSGYAPNGFPI